MAKSRKLDYDELPCEIVTNRAPAPVTVSVKRAAVFSVVAVDPVERSVTVRWRVGEEPWQLSVLKVGDSLVAHLDLCV